MGKIDIKRATINDLDSLRIIGKSTFYETFSSSNTEENMSRYLEEGFSVQTLTQEIKDNNSEFYLATLDARTIGYLKLNFGQSQTEIRDDKAIEIERIYVLKEFQGKNVGQLLFDLAIKIGKERKMEYVWLGVWEKNARAINFYKKNGFVEFGRHIFMLGIDKQTDIMMKRMLNGL